MHAWTWFLQRISAVFLVIVLGLHIGFLHFSNAGETLNYSDIMIRLKTPVLISLDILLLIFGLYHALYGLYSIFLDFNSGKKERVVVFVDGDFWHGRNWRQRKKKLKEGSNPEYWAAKIQANIDRDRRQEEELSEAGWTVVRLWETDILDDPAAAAEQIALTLKKAAS